MPLALGRREMGPASLTPLAKVIGVQEPKITVLQIDFAGIYGRRMRGQLPVRPPLLHHALSRQNVVCSLDSPSPPSRAIGFRLRCPNSSIDHGLDLLCRHRSMA